MNKIKSHYPWKSFCSAVTIMSSSEHCPNLMLTIASLKLARRRPGPSRTRHRLGLHSHTSPPPRPLDGARRSTSRPRVDRRLGRRPRGPAGSGRPDPVRRAARRQPGPAGSGRPACGLSFTYSVTLTLHSTLITPVRPHPPRPALAQRRSGTPPVVQPGHGSSPHAGPRASYQVSVSQTAAPSGSPLRLRRKGDPEPSGCPAGPRASVSYRDPRKVSRCGLLVPSFRWAAPGSGAERSGTPPVARPSRWVEPHVSLQLPVSPCCGPLVPQLRAGRSWLWRGAIRNPTGCPVESASRAARQPSVPAPSRSVSAAPSPAASAPKRQLIAPPQPRPAQVLSGRRTLIRALGASGGTRQRRPSAVVSAR